MELKEHKIKNARAESGYYYNYTLQNISAKDIRFKNLAGRMTGSQYDDPNRPKHELVVWIDDPEILKAFKKLHVPIGERVNSDTGESRFSVRFKAYPKMKWSPIAKSERPYPKVIIRDGETMTRLKIENFSEFDRTIAKSYDITFYTYENTKQPGTFIPTITEAFLTVDEEAGQFDKSYLDEMYGYVDEPDEEAVPFD